MRCNADLVDTACSVTMMCHVQVQNIRSTVTRCRQTLAEFQPLVAEWRPAPDTLTQPLTAFDASEAFAVGADRADAVRRAGELF